MPSATRKRKTKRSAPKKDRKDLYAGRTEEEWRQWGEDFGKSLAKQGRDFGEEVAKLAQGVGQSQKHRRFEFIHSPFGALGPLLGAVVGSVFLALGIVILAWLNTLAGSIFIAAIVSFLSVNFPIFFVIYLYSGYRKYFAFRKPREYMMVSPVAIGISIIIALWIIAGLLGAVATAAGNSAVASAAGSLSSNLVGIFIAAVVLGYALILLMKSARGLPI